jgi:hypothetical protein
MFSEIQDTIMEKKINLFHVVVGIFFALIPLFIANRTITNAQLVDGLQILGYGIIVVHLFIILTYHFNKVKEMADDDTTNPPSTKGVPVIEEYSSCIKRLGFAWFYPCCTGLTTNWAGQCVG